MAEGAGGPPAASIKVTVMYSPQPRTVQEWTVFLPVGANVLQGLEASGMSAGFPDIDLRGAQVAVWGRKARLDQALRENDRIEILRPLKVDPKLARRERFRKQGARAAGLFARKRDGSRPGY